MRTCARIVTSGILLGALAIAPSARAEPLNVVEYAGLRIPVPSGWPVYDLARDPSQCLRYDRHAVYLGVPGPDQDCPAHVVGRTETLQIVKATGSGQGARRIPFQDVQVPDTPDQQVTAAATTGAEVTGTYGEDKDLLQHLIQSITVDPDAVRPAALAPRDAVLPKEPVPRDAVPPKKPEGGAQPKDAGDALPKDTSGALLKGAKERVQAAAQEQAAGAWAAGYGFDSCAAPSAKTMAAWRSAYSIYNIYIGGVARGCSQPNLTAGWIRSVRRLGYRLIPTFVGLQAPCTSYTDRFTPRNAAAKGEAAAGEAAGAAGQLGIPRNQPIYYDMEAYRAGHASCRKAVLAFLDAWTRALERHGYIPGVYSSAASGIRDLAHASYGIARPPVIWFARWDNNPSVVGSPYVPNSAWIPHRRIKQYRGDHRESHGGAALTVDSNAVDGRVF